jgi:putative ABC transport system ATP-binding protein
LGSDSAIDAAPLFVFDRVTVAGADGPRLEDATGEVPADGVTVMVGPSGSGKSTLLRCCNRLEVPVRGEVRYRGTAVEGLDPLELRRRVGMVFQRPTPVAGTVLANLRVAEPTLDEGAAARELARVGLDASMLRRDARELSGGEAQRVCLARTLTTRPEVVLMDEVTSSVDPAARRTLEDLASALARSGVPVVWVTHDLEQMRRLADHVILVIGGRIVHAGAPSRLGADAPDVAQRFLAGDAA